MRVYCTTNAVYLVEANMHALRGMLCSILLYIVKRSETGRTNCILLHKILLHHVQYIVLYRCNISCYIQYTIILYCIYCIDILRQHCRVYCSSSRRSYTILQNIVVFFYSLDRIYSAAHII